MSGIQGSLTKLLRSAAIVFPVTVLARGLALGAEIVIIRSLSPSQFGTIAVAYTIALMLGRLALFGVPQGVTRYISEGITDSNQRLVAKHGLLIVVPIAAVASVLLLLFATHIGAVLNNDGIPRYLVFFVPFVLVFPLSRVAIAVLRARGRTVPAVLSKDLLSRIGGLALFATFAAAGAAELGAVAYWVILPFISLVATVYFVHRELGVNDVLMEAVNWSSLYNLWSFSWPLALSSSLILLFSNMDLLMIEYFLTSEAAGYYRSVQPLRQITQFVLSSFIFLYMPLATQYFSNGEIKLLSEFYKTSTKWITSLTLPLVVVFTVFADAVVTTFFGPEYLPASVALAVLVGGLFFNVLVGPNGATAKAIERPRIDLFAAAVGFVVNLGLNVLLIPRYGIVGAATATVVGYVTFNAVEVALIYRTIGSLPFSINQLKPLIPTILAGMLLRELLGHNFGLPELVAIGVFLSGFHLVSMVLTRSIDENDLDVVRQVETKLDREIPYLWDAIDRFSEN